jgi:flagellar biosynthesis protein FlhG
VPEPTSIENAYRFIKGVYFRRLRDMEAAWNLRPLVAEAAAAESARGLLAPMELLAYVEKRDPEAGALLRAELSRFPVELVVNQTRTPEEEQLGQAISTACRRHFGVCVRYLASIPHDEAVLRAVRRRRPVVLEEPASGASHAIRRIAAALGLGE